MVRGVMRITTVHRPARMVSMGFGLAFMFSILLVVGIYRSVEGINGDGGFQELVFSKENNNTPTAFARKLLAMADDDDNGDGDDNAGNTMNRIGGTCSKDNIVVFQGPTSPLPNGIPTYTVQILNVCVSGCSVSDIHLSCGWFSSARLINPRIFRRVYFNDCLVNNGEPLSPGESLSFQYANSFSYPLSVSSIAC
ncbi:TPD1 protein homolog 1-like [Actinidia eriantha]|uniref:TPD1 protein homolog 1-like n=1 Tax=Actinidia eriantha TaxID=165200 RepID=UPI002589C988|nr:TPD1 protein homolog 1-like [Actinidia eriantha]